MTEFKLASEFPDPAKTDWLALVEQSLKGADFNKRLVSTTYDGIKIQPLYTADDAIASVVPESADNAPWRIAQAHAQADPSAANAAILESLEGGANAVVLDIAESANGPGIQIWTLADLEKALSDVHLDAVPVHLNAGARSLEVAALFAALAVQKKLDGASLSGSLGIDPVSALARSGALPASAESLYTAAAKASDALPGLQPVTVSTQAYHQAGCSEAQELAFALGAGIAALRGLEAASLSLEDAAKAIRFSLTADADVFLTIAKFRAWQAVWTKVLVSCGVTGIEAACDAETATRMATQRDPWVNMLRATAATFAAATGGAKTITVAPYTEALGSPDGFARRIARNVQTVLAEESHIGSVADAARGSWYLERLTAELAENAWSLFQTIEAKGGMVAALTSGAVKEMIAGVQETRSRDIARRKLSITGVSEFPNLHEDAPSLGTNTKADAATTTQASDWDGLLTIATDGGAPALTGDGAETCTALPALRLAQAFEAYRDASDAKTKATGKRPRIFLAHFGGPADYTARVTFAQNLFEAGGIEALTPKSSTGDLVLAFEDSGTEIVCLCSSDAYYETHALQAVTDLKGAGATMVFIAGKPGAQEAALEDAGVNEYIFMGCNVLDILDEVHTHLHLTRED